MRASTKKAILHLNMNKVVNVGISERKKLKIDLNEIQDEVVRPRIRRGKSGKDADRTEMIIPARVQFQQTALSLSDKDLEALVDTGSEMEALAGFELFDKGTLKDASKASCPHWGRQKQHQRRQLGRYGQFDPASVQT